MRRNIEAFTYDWMAAGSSTFRMLPISKRCTTDDVSSCPMAPLGRSIPYPRCTPRLSAFSRYLASRKDSLPRKSNLAAFNQAHRVVTDSGRDTKSRSDRRNDINKRAGRAGRHREKSRSPRRGSLRASLPSRRTNGRRDLVAISSLAFRLRKVPQPLA